MYALHGRVSGSGCCGYRVWAMGQETDRRGDARVCVISHRAVKAQLSRCCAFEFEDTIGAMDSVDVYAPDPVRPSGVVEKLCRKVSRRTPLSVSYEGGVAPLRIEGEYEVLFFAAQSAADLRALEQCVGWRDRCGKAVCWLEEVWASAIAESDRLRRDLDILKQFDHVIINCHGSVEALSAHLGRPCVYAAPGVDTLRFCPYPSPPDRSIDVNYFGRRSPVTHAALLELAARDGLYYVFDTRHGQDVQDPAEHRTFFAETLKRSRYCFANRAKANKGSQTQGQDEVGFRFFECAAAGAVMIGDPPKVASFGENFDWEDVLIEAPFDCEEIGQVLSELDGRPDRVARMRARNVVHSLRRHDWLYRWRSILSAVGVDESDGMKRRAVRLEQLATEVERESLARTTAEAG